MRSTRFPRWSLLFLAALALFAAALVVGLLVNGVNDLTRAPTCDGAVMGQLDGCEVLHGGVRGAGDVQIYWPGGLMGGIARSIPADRHLQSRAQMHSDARTAGIFQVLAGSALLVAAAFVPGRLIIRRWQRSRSVG
ncbi:hypothetical protein OG203_05815 [Nocardia sp. NBC_01499]|uniref:hypothetical protein n=1 Tax=Nocardia sp. NBC_01499 TaxID=2903597 RepID=UPI00386B4DD8